MKNKRPPRVDDQSVIDLTNKYAEIEKKLIQVIVEPQETSIAVFEQSINKTIDAAVNALEAANKQFANTLTQSYEEGKKDGGERIKVSGRSGKTQHDSGIDWQKKYEAVRRGAYIDLNAGLAFASRALKSKVKHTIRKLDDGNKHLNAFTSAIKTTLKDEHILEIKYANGANMPLDAYARMLSRSSRTETMNIGNFQAASEFGSDLVKCTIVSPTCELCATYQGRVYSISGNDKRFPTLFETAFKHGYTLIHPNCRHEFLPYFEELRTPEELKKDIAYSNRAFKDTRSGKERDAYAAWQAWNRRNNSEEKEYLQLKKQLGDDMPYNTLGGFRRASRAKSNEYLATKARYSVRARHLDNLTKNAQNGKINIDIDELTPCLRDGKTGELLETEFKAIKTIDSGMLKRNGWKFDWSKPFADNEKVIKLAIKNDSDTQGLIAYREDPRDMAFYVSLVESAPHNLGSNGEYKGVGGHLFAIVCSESYKKGYGGFVYFDAKTRLIEHYKKELGAKTLLNSNRMYIDETAAQKLIERYFKDER